MKNCVLITAYTNCSNAGGHYTDIERWDQLVNYTIPSLRDCIPNTELFLIDGTILTDVQKSTLNQLNVELFNEGDYIDTKNLGELNMIKRFINSFTDFNYNSFSKITGRYSAEFEQDFFTNKEFIFKRRVSWMSYEIKLIETFFYKFPAIYFNIFKEKINNLDIFTDLEHSFEKNGIFKDEEGVEKLFITCRGGSNGVVEVR